MGKREPLGATMLSSASHCFPGDPKATGWDGVVVGQSQARHRVQGWAVLGLPINHPNPCPWLRAEGAGPQESGWAKTSPRTQCLADVASPWGLPVAPSKGV